MSIEITLYSFSILLFSVTDGLVLCMHDSGGGTVSLGVGGSSEATTQAGRRVSAITVCCIVA